MFNVKYLELISEDLTSKVLSKFGLLKMKIVAKDRECRNIRNYLNFGHTLGHAIEISMNIPHGIAVGIGMLLLIKDQQQKTLLTSAFSTIGFDYKLYIEQLKSVDKEQLISLLKNDKKNNSDLLTIVTMKKPGRGSLEQITYKDLFENYLK
jgi:3-dehydroquinate synthase